MNQQISLRIIGTVKANGSNDATPTACIWVIPLLAARYRLIAGTYYMPTRLARSVLSQQRKQ
jgi:hypothetical protein